MTIRNMTEKEREREKIIGFLQRMIQRKETATAGSGLGKRGVEGT